MKKRNKLVIVIGNVGVGKTTLTDLLAKQLPAKKIAADLYKQNPFFDLAVKNRRRWSLASDIWFLYKRVERMRKAVDWLNKRHVVVDSGLPMSLVYSRSRIECGHFIREEWELYEQINSEFSSNLKKPDVVVVLESPVDLLRQRIVGRNRDFEIKKYKIGYLKTLSKNISLVAKKLKKEKIKIIKVNIKQFDFISNKKDLNNLIKEILS